MLFISQWLSERLNYFKRKTQSALQKKLMLFVKNMHFDTVSGQSGMTLHDRVLIFQIRDEFLNHNLTISGEEGKLILGDELDKNMENLLRTGLRLDSTSRKERKKGKICLQYIQSASEL